MTDYSISQLRKFSESYEKMIESEDTVQNPIDFSKVQYAMVKLDEPAKNWLESESKKILESKKFKKFYCGHLTLAYGEDELKKRFSASHPPFHTP